MNENHSIRPVIESVIESGCQRLKLVDTARLFALVNIATEDTTIAAFDSKYSYNLWRRYHAVRLADTDGNPGTEADPTRDWLFTAPRHQEYRSAHAVITTAFMKALVDLIGDDHTFTLSASGHPGFTWTFDRFSDTAAQTMEARIWAGIHYRFSCNLGAEQGMKLFDYVLENFLLPLKDGDHDDDDGREGREHQGRGGRHEP